MNPEGKVFLRNQEGRTAGPLDAAQVRSLIERGRLSGKVLLSEDGVSFAAPGHFPAWRELFPQAMWGLEAAAPPSVTAVGTFEGDLANESAIKAYAKVAQGESNGLLHFDLGDRKVEIGFRKGTPDRVESDHPEDALEVFLITQKLTTAEQIGRANTEKDRFGGDLLGALFALGALNPSSAFPQLLQRAQQIAVRPFLSVSGTFRFEPQNLPSQKSLPLGNKWAVLSELMRRVPLPEVKRRLGADVDRAAMKSGGHASPEELRLTPRELRALGQFDGVRSLARVAQDLPGDAESIFRVALLLRELGAIGFTVAVHGVRPEGAEAPAASAPPPALQRPAPASTGAAQPPVVAAGTPGAPKPPQAATPPMPPAVAAGTPGAPRPPPPSGGGPTPPMPPVVAAGTPGAPKPPPPLAPAAAGPPKPPPPVPGFTPPTGKPAAAPPRPPPPPAAPSAPAAPVDFNAEIKALRERHEAQQKQDLFERLGVPQSADSRAIKMAYFALAKQLHPDTVPAGSPPELAKLRADVFSAVGEAYRRLSDDKERANYLEELKLGGTGEQVDVARILGAEENFTKGTILVKARKFPEAVKLLDEAIEANPDEGEFYAWRGYAKFFLTPDRAAGRTEAQKDLDTALKKNARCAPAHYFIGHIAKLSGDNSTALTHFKKAVELNPNHIDAARELRILGGKR